eukprot:807126-Pyramimonas_sp.AAC.1
MEKSLLDSLDREGKTIVETADRGETTLDLNHLVEWTKVMAEAIIIFPHYEVIHSVHQESGRVTRERSLKANASGTVVVLDKLLDIFQPSANAEDHHAWAATYDFTASEKVMDDLKCEPLLQAPGVRQK